MGDDFYASIKLKNGEEIYSKVASSDEDGVTHILLCNPIVVEPIKVKGKQMGYKMEPWMKTTTEDMFVISLDDILTMSESTDIEMILYYEDYLKKSNQPVNPKPSAKMGYLGTIDDAKKALEKLYKL